MIHGRSYNNKENIDFQEIVLFEKICYQMVLKRANLTEEEIDKFVEAILFSFQNNLLK
jgi:CRISPR/Cas system type I-B associated protein Csh2 (Cas7 group RAMP superfamily)